MIKKNTVCVLFVCLNSYDINACISTVCSDPSKLYIFHSVLMLLFIFYRHLVFAAFHCILRVLIDK